MPSPGQAGLVSLRLPDRERTQALCRVSKSRRRGGSGPGRIDRCAGIAAPLGDRAHRVRGGRPGRRDLQDRQLPRQSDGSRRPSILFEIRLGDALVAGDPADCARTDAGRDAALRISYQGNRANCAPHDGTASPRSDSVMLVRRRLSRIFYRRRFFDYPLKLNANTLKNMGVAETLRVGLSYAQARLARRSPGKLARGFSGQSLRRASLPNVLQGLHRESLGRALHGDQRRLGRAAHQGPFGDQSARACAQQRRFARRPIPLKSDTETSLIERFLYPKLGPGQMWEAVAREVTARGGAGPLAASCGRHRAKRRHGDAPSRSATRRTGSVRRVACDYFISTHAGSRSYRHALARGRARRAIAQRLPYRDFMTAGLLLRRMTCRARAARAQPPTACPG